MLLIIFVVLSSALIWAGGSFHINRIERIEQEVEQCLIDQVELYDDLCAEESTGYEVMTPKIAHRLGVKCAVETARICIKNRY